MIINLDSRMRVHNTDKERVTSLGNHAERGGAGGVWCDPGPVFLRMENEQ